MQMMETVAVLIIFFILVAFGLIFYGNMMKGKLDITKLEQSELRAVELSEKVSSLPELQCSEDNIIETNCIDLLKLEAAGPIMQNNRLTYFEVLGFSEVTIQEIFPLANTYTVYSNIPADYKEKLPSFVPVSLKNPIGKQYGFGLMTITLYSR